MPASSMDALTYAASMGRRSDVHNTESPGDTLSPLPPVLTRGLTAVATLGFASFLSSAILFLYLTYKLVRWQLKPVTVDNGHGGAYEPQSHAAQPNAFLVANSHLCPQRQPGQPGWVDTANKSPRPPASFWGRLRREPPNQFLVLVYNLLFADIQQASAFLLNVQWLIKSAVVVDTPICWAQGWFISTGDMASSAFVTAIAAHTYMGVVHDYRLPTRAFYCAIVLLWCFVYGLALLGVIITKNGAGVGGLYVRAGAWCWINAEYQNLRLYLHYLWIFLALGVTSALYIVIFLHMHRHKARPGSSYAAEAHGAHYPNTEPNAGTSQPLSAPSTAESGGTTGASAPKRLPPAARSARHPTFLLYPIIYVLCTTPLAAGRIASMAGRSVSLAYFCFAGTMIAAAGFLDVVLYSSTRRSIVFAGDAPPSQDTGLETFAFMRTPAGRKYGNIVYVHGGGDGTSNKGPKGKRWRSWNGSAVSGGRLGMGGDRRQPSQSSLRGFGAGAGAGEVMGMAIQCDVVATITVEQANDLHERIDDRVDDTASLNSRMGIIESSEAYKS